MSLPGIAVEDGVASLADARQSINTKEFKRMDARGQARA